MPDCQPIIDEISELKQERADLQAELHGGLDGHFPVGQEKAAIVQQIKALNARIATKESELHDCLGLPPAKPAITCPLTGGTTTLRTSSSAFAGPFPLAISPILTFLAPDHTAVELASITTAFGPVPIPSTPCSDTLTVVIPAAVGSFNATTGDVSIPISATISHSLSGGPFNICALSTPPSSLVSSPLTTGALTSALSGTLFGSPLARPSGAMTLVASGMITSGASQLVGVTVDLRITGSLTCVPLP